MKTNPPGVKTNSMLKSFTLAGVNLDLTAEKTKDFIRSPVSAAHENNFFKILAQKKTEFLAMSPSDSSPYFN
jgi:hypothetical protein